MCKVSLLTTKSKNSFQSFILAIHHWEMSPDRIPVRRQSRCFTRIGRMQICALALDLSTFQSIIFHHLKKLDIWVLHTLSEKNKKRSHIHNGKCFFEAEKCPVSQEHHYRWLKKKWVFYDNASTQRWIFTVYPKRQNFMRENLYCMYTEITKVSFLFTQPLHSGRIWHKVNFLSGV